MNLGDAIELPYSITHWNFREHDGTFLLPSLLHPQLNSTANDCIVEAAPLVGQKAKREEKSGQGRNVITSCVYADEICRVPITGIWTRACAAHGTEYISAWCNGLIHVPAPS